MNTHTSSDLGAAFKRWKVPCRRVSAPFRKWFVSVYGGWKFKNAFLSNVPEKTASLVEGGVIRAYVYDEEGIMDLSTKGNSCDFILVGYLKNGSLIGIDVKDPRIMRIGSFSVENCAASDWTNLQLIDFTPFPYSYAEFLNVIYDDLRCFYLAC